MNAPETTERRLTPTERLHDLARAAIERQSQRHASFSVSQVKAVGGATVIEWDVQVPVCDEYPTAEQAFAAVTNFADRMLVNYPPPAPNGEASVARQAAAIASKKAKAVTA
jgi:hypothetical protein